MSRLAVVLTVPLLLTLGSTVPTSLIHTSPQPAPRPGGDLRAANVLADLPLTFVEDPGAGGIDYRTAWGPAAVGFARGGLDLALTDTAGTTQRWGLRLDFTGARPAAPNALARTPGVVSYFRGPPDEWRVGLSTYARVAYQELWPGIDLVFRGGSGSLKYSFRLDAGADPEAIGLDWRGATVSLAEGGGLHIATPAGALLDGAPVVWQPGPEGRTRVAASWEQRANGSWGFGLRRYDPGRPLVIDPEVLFTTFIGGSSNENAAEIAVDGAGATYIAGSLYEQTGMTNFPASVGPDSSFNGQSDVFVAKVNPGGKGIAYAGFIGGTESENAGGIAVDATGAAFVTGYTSSDTGEGFPASSFLDTTLGGSEDVFLAKVQPDGTGLAYAGYIGGNNTEYEGDVAVDGSGAAYVVGATWSFDFPATIGPDTSWNDNLDAFIAKVKPNGSAFDYAGFIGAPPTTTARAWPWTGPEPRMWRGEPTQTNSPSRTAIRTRTTPSPSPVPTRPTTAPVRASWPR